MFVRFSKDGIKGADFGKIPTHTGKKNKVLQSGFKVGAVVKHGGSNRSNFGLNFLHNRV